MNVNHPEDWAGSRCYDCGGRTVGGTCARRCHEGGDPIPLDAWSEPKLVCYESVKLGFVVYRHCFDQPTLDRWLADAQRRGYEPEVLTKAEAKERNRASHAEFLERTKREWQERYDRQARKFKRDVA